MYIYFTSDVYILHSFCNVNSEIVKYIYFTVKYIYFTVKYIFTITGGAIHLIKQCGVYLPTDQLILSDLYVKKQTIM